MKVYFDTVGCRLNQAEIEEMAAILRSAGHEIASRVDEADTVIINSCAVTAAASSDSRQKVRQAHQLGIENIIFTGCWVSLYPQQAAKLEGVTSVVDNLEKMKIPARLLNTDDLIMDLEPIAREPLPGVHHRTRAFIKAQDGCDNYCTYCVTRLARGKAVSIPVENVLFHVDEAIDGGTKEIVLTGVNLGSWGKYLEEKRDLGYLVKEILDKTKIERVRLSSLEPWDIEESFFALWDDARMCPHLHLPLQSGSGTVLKRMARNTTPERFLNLVDFARKRIRNLSITTDIIVGFPGESDGEFEESLEFIKHVGFTGGHVFRYSKRENTAAAKFPQQVLGTVSKVRAQQVREVLSEQEKLFLTAQCGKDHKVLWESCKEIESGSWRLEGYSENYCRVQAASTENRWNKIDTVKAVKIKGNILIGKIIPSRS